MWVAVALAYPRCHPWWYNSYRPSEPSHSTIRFKENITAHNTQQRFTYPCSSGKRTGKHLLQRLGNNPYSCRVS